MKNIFTLLTGIGLISFHAFSQVNLQQGLQLYYPMAGDLTDSAGMNDAQNNNVTFTQDMFGNPSEAVSFNGTNSYALVPHPTNNDLQFFDGDFAVSFRLKNNNSSSQMVFQKGLSGTTNGTLTGYDQMWMRINDPTGSIRLTTYSEDFSPANENVLLLVGSELNDGLWHHVVAQRNGDTLELYWDGCLMDTAHIGASIIDCNNDTALILGAQNPNPIAGLSYENWYSGAMDDFRLYDRVLNCEEIDSLKIYNPNNSISTIEYREQTAIRAYPNPTSGTLNFDMGEMSNSTQLQVFNVFGQLQDVIAFTTQRFEYELMGSPGIYFIVVTSGNNNQHTLKVTKQ